MASAELERLRVQLTAVPFDAAQSLTDARAGIDALGDSYAVPDGVKVESTELGGTPAERLTFDDNGPVVLYQRCSDSARLSVGAASPVPRGVG